MKILLVVFVSVLLFVNSILSQTCCCNIVQSVFGFVEAENRTIFKIYYPFSFDLCLVSTIGDADLYISDRNPSPSYNLDSYLLHSATCGEDSIHVHKSLKRPIYVSVFGHPSFAISHFYVNIVARESSEEDFINLQLLDLEDFKNTSSSLVDDSDVPTVPCPAGDELTESVSDEQGEINLVHTTESTDDLSSAPLNEETVDADEEHGNSSNSVDQNITNNLEGTSSENSRSDESSQSFTSFLQTPTDYENQMFLDILHEDGLLISAKGLGVETVFLNLIKIYCDPGNLVFVLGTNAEEENYIIAELTKQEVTYLPKVITAEKSIAERETIYTEGGVLFISTRIIVVDLLKRRIPIKHITGFLVNRAHKILESCQDGFALRLFRLENKSGFVKAFSSWPESFTRGFSRVERVMKTLFVRNLYLWPRFQAVVNSSLERCKPEVVELHLQLTPPMLELQTALLDLISYVVREVKRINPVLDTDEVTVENALSNSFHQLLQVQLDPVWHQLSSATKQLLADLKTLRHVLLSLTQTDSVRFNNLVTSLRSTEYAHRSSGWVLLDSAETLFVTASQRLYNSKHDVDPEPNPKWRALDEILKEIRGASSDSETVLILVSSIETCRQLKDYLIRGAKKMLADLYKRFFGNKEHTAPNSVVEPESEEDADNDCFTLSQQTNLANGGISFTECSEENIGAEPVIIIQPFRKENDVLSLPKTLKMHKPQYVVMYDADITAIRQIEVFQSSNTDFRMTVYFLIYAGAVEEQAYLTTLRRERSAFEFLISEKSSMVVPAEQDGKSGDCPELTRDSGKSVFVESEVHNTRKGGAQKSPTNPLIIVDVREFRSELPVLLHRRGMDIDPVTLQIGDYILSPDMCVERKSINDLVGSLNTGRLYQQAMAMTRHYAKPMLLIEFDHNKPFDLQGRYYLSKDLSSTDITAKLQLLTLHFPKLKIVWSPSPYATAQLFQEIKDGKPEPDPSAAVAVGLEDGNYAEDKYNSNITDFVGKLPGITTQNIYSILNNAESLENLLTFSKEELKKILQNTAQSEELYNALHHNFKNSPAPPIATKSKKPRGFRAINKKK